MMRYCWVEEISVIQGVVGQRKQFTYSPRKRESLPVEDDEEEQQQPRSSSRPRQKRLHQGRPVDAPGGVAHRSDGHRDDGNRHGEPADPGGRHGSVVRPPVWPCAHSRLV